MSTATITKPPSQTVSLLEIASGQCGSGTVDSDAGVIRGVKVVGLLSENIGRTVGLSRNEFGPAVDQPYGYTAESLEKARTLYEGVGVYVDHPQFSYGPDGSRKLAPGDRKVSDRIGRLVNVRATAEGLFADLEYIKSHPLASQLVEVAQRMPEQLGLSHRAACRFERRGDRAVVVEILKVDSVDLVGDRCGTTKGLFESLESNMEPDISTPPVAAGTSDPGESVKWGFRDAITGVLDGDGDKKEKLAKIKALLDAEEKAAAALSGETSKPADAPPDTPAAESVAKLTQEIKRLKARETARELLESSGVPGDAAKVDALAALETDEQRKALLATWPKCTVTGGAIKPRSTPVHIAESAAGAPEPRSMKDCEITAAKWRA